MLNKLRLFYNKRGFILLQTPVTLTYSFLIIYKSLYLKDGNPGHFHKPRLNQNVFIFTWEGEPAHIKVLPHVEINSSRFHYGTQRLHAPDDLTTPYLWTVHMWRSHSISLGSRVEWCKLQCMLKTLAAVVAQVGGQHGLQLIARRSLTWEPTVNYVFLVTCVATIFPSIFTCCLRN